MTCKLWNIFPKTNIAWKKLINHHLVLRWNVYTATVLWFHTGLIFKVIVNNYTIERWFRYMPVHSSLSTMWFPAELFLCLTLWCCCKLLTFIIVNLFNHTRSAEVFAAVGNSVIILHGTLSPSYPTNDQPTDRPIKNLSYGINGLLID